MELLCCRQLSGGRLDQNIASGRTFRYLKTRVPDGYTSTSFSNYFADANIDTQYYDALV